MTQAFGLNVIGYASANLGHGVAFRNTVAILERKGIPFSVLDIDPGGNRTGHDHSAAGHYHRIGEPLPHPVNLFHLNPPEIEALFRDLPGLVRTEGRMNVSVLFWELARLPLSWRPMLEAMDLVLVPSRFVQATFGEAVHTTPCLYYRQGLEMPRAVPDRGKWGFPEGRTVFLFSFDISSGIQRKHPLAAMEAFRTAFPDGGACLVLKVNNPDLSPEAGRMVDRIREAAEGIRGVRVVDRSMSYADVLSLYASADVLVSLHRGEGLGLSLMEFMALGKPVIATAWSGNMDFMDDANSCPIPYRLVPLEMGTQYHAISRGVDQVWAEPSVEEAARWMRMLDASPDLRREIGEKARESILRFRGEAERGRVFDRIRERWERNFAGDARAGIFR
jgi:glycosyltransferase involved in cell wall biosynthesis